MSKSLAVWTLSLGCPKNTVDTETLLGSLGARIHPVATPGRARLVLINTCAFIEPACRESLRAIFDVAIALGRVKRKPLLVVAGCLPGRYGIDELAREIPEVDLWLDSKSIAEWPRKLNAVLGIAEPVSGARLLSTRSYAWLKISEGCQHRCAFCTIPSIRGPLRSMPASEIMAHARQALEKGVRELVLVGQDISAWGRDLIALGANTGPATLADLVRNLRELAGLRWLRLMYLYPAAITDDLLRLMAEGAPVLPYLDVPFQHCQPEILAAMGRPFKSDAWTLVERIRKYLPDAALRTTLITGYPGETERDFAELCRFIREVRFQNLGVFPYMPEEGTKAATLPDQVPTELKEERVAEIMRIQAEISRDLLAEYVGSHMEILVDKNCDDEWPGLHSGRVWFQAPEVDGSTYISGPGVAPGKMLRAEIVHSSDYDLSALA